MVVVLSILIAFGLDAWWGNVREAVDVRLELANVRDELVEIRMAVQSRADLFERVVEGSTALISVMENSQDEPYVVVPDTIAYWANALPRLNPRVSSLDALIASGRLAAVNDRELRSALGALRGRMEDAVVELERSRTIFFSVHFSELGRDFDLAPIMTIVEARRGQLDESEAVPSAGSIRYPNRLIVWNQTRERRLNVQGALIAFRQLTTELYRIEGLLSHTLND